MKYRPDIDGLRALAVTAVVLYHAAVPPFTAGFVGVDIFFVISGYLIGGIIYRELNARNFSFLVFYARRARRILPALFAVATFTCIVGWFLLDANELHGVGSTAASALLALSNISFWHYQDYFAGDSKLTPLLMTWTLGVEEQFYIIFPFLLMASMRLFNRHIVPVLSVIAAASFGFSLWATWAHPATAYYLLPARAWELAAGTILASYEIMCSKTPSRISKFMQDKNLHEVFGLAGLALIATSIFVFDEHTPFPGYVALLPVFGALALIMAPKSTVNRLLLSAEPVVFVGLISYSWYLWHWPLLSYLRILFFNHPPQIALNIVAALSFGIAILSWRYIEQPFRHAHNKPRVTLMRYAGVMILVLILPLALKFTHGFPQRLNAQTQKIEAGIKEGRGNCMVMFDASEPDPLPQCNVSVAGRPKIALIGDSHAAALGPGLREFAAKEKMGIEILTKSNCAPLLGVTTASWRHPDLVATCPVFMSNAVAKVAADPDVKTVFLAAFWASRIHPHDKEYYSYSPAHDPDATRDEILRASLQITAGVLKHAGKRVVIVEDVPIWNYDPVLMSLNHAIPLRRAIAGWLSEFMGGPVDNPEQPQDELGAPIVKDAARAEKVDYLNLYSRFCPPDGCIYMQGDDVLYIDAHHLSVVGSRYAFADYKLKKP